MPHDSMPRREAGDGSARPDGDRRSFATPTFGEAGPALEEAGFQALPITPPDPGDRDAGKKPPASLARWQHPRPVAERLPRYAGCGVGLLTATTPAVDIDVRHLEIADAVDRVVVAALGDAPVRYGAAPLHRPASRPDYRV